MKNNNIINFEKTNINLPNIFDLCKKEIKNFSIIEAREGIVAIDTKFSYSSEDDSMVYGCFIEYSSNNKFLVHDGMNNFEMLDDLSLFERATYNQNVWNRFGALKDESETFEAFFARCPKSGYYTTRILNIIQNHGFKLENTCMICKECETLSEAEYSVFELIKISCLLSDIKVPFPGEYYLINKEKIKKPN